MCTWAEIWSDFATQTKTRKLVEVPITWSKLLLKKQTIRGNFYAYPRCICASRRLPSIQIGKRQIFIIMNSLDINKYK